MLGDDMLSYNNFKAFFKKIDNGKELALDFYNGDTYLLVKHKDYILYGIHSPNSKIITSNDLDELPLKDKWDSIKDITIDFAFSLVNDKEDILKIYGFKL